MKNTSHMPYSQKGLEDLALALGVDSSLLWVSPATGHLDIKVSKRFRPQQQQEDAGYELEESE